jgi:hypothetical protein
MAGRPSGKTLMTRIKNLVSAEPASPAPEQVVLEEGAPGTRPGATFRAQPEVAAALTELAGTAVVRGPARFKSGMQYVSIVLNKLGIRRIPRYQRDRSWLYQLLTEADKYAGSRPLFEQSDKQLDGLVSAVRFFVLSRTAAFGAEWALARATARAMRGGTVGPRGVVHTSVDLPSGVWTFFHTSGADPIVVRETFTPVSGGSLTDTIAIPARPTFPGKGTPRWLGRSGSIYRAPPAAGSRPPAVVTGIPVTLLRDAPPAIAEQLFRTEAANLARTRVPVTNKKVEIVGAVPATEEGKTGTLGYGIERIIFKGPDEPGGAYDYKVTVEGTALPSVPRPGDEDVLPRGGLLGLMDAVRLHLWGPILGDSTPAGLAYGPAKLNRLQLDTIEGFLKTGKRGSAVGAKVRATAYIKTKMVRGKLYPFLQTAVYEITLEDGSVQSFELGVDENGEVFGPVSRVAPNAPAAAEN